jgi:hypothetical protein
MPRKCKLDPKAVKALAEIEDLTVKVERWWRRLRRAVTALEKCRRRRASLQRRLDSPGANGA